MRLGRGRCDISTEKIEIDEQGLFTQRQAFLWLKGTSWPMIVKFGAGDAEHFLALRMRGISSYFKLLRFQAFGEAWCRLQDLAKRSVSIEK